MPKKSNHPIICEHYRWNLFQRDNVFYADGRLNQPSLGKHSLGTRDPDQTYAALRELDRRMAISRKLIQVRPEDSIREILIKAGWAQYLAHCSRPDVLGGAGPATQKRYRAVQDKHEIFCLAKGAMTWNSVDKKHIEGYGSYLAKQGYADATVYLECTLLKQVVKWLIEEERALLNLTGFDYRYGACEQSDTYCPTREQVKVMIERCQNLPELHWLADVIIGLVTTGMRIGELAALRWTDIDPGSGIISLPDNRHSGRHKKAGAVRKTKGRRGRQIPIHAHLRTILKSIPRRADGLVFSGPSGGRLLPNSTCKILIRDVIAPLNSRFPTPKNEIGFADCRLHSFRHAFVSQAFLDGVSEGEIRSWVGHTNSRIVERYRHLRNEDAQRKMQQIKFFDDGVDPNAGALPEGSDGPAHGHAAHDETQLGETASSGVPNSRER